MKRIIQAVLLGLAPLAPLQADAPPVTIDSGILHGREDGPVTTFLGIPYAAAPIGLLRWQSPQPTTPWSGVRDATSLGAKCLQYSWAPPLRFEGSEDCLFLNVVTPRPAAGARLPVLVWFHAGGWVNGSSQDVDGRVFAAKGVVVVTVNYRLGAFGFYASPALDAEDPAHVSGNYAQRDQQAALRWVQRNIAAFGGDPAQVTIAGQSAGALSNWIHLVSPAAKGLFARVIGESPVVSFHPAAGLDDARGVGGTKTLQEEEAAGASAHLASILGCDASADPLACMRGKPAPDIVAAMKPGVPGWGVGWGPVVDGVLLPASPPALLAKRRPPIAVLTGGNWGENGIFTLRKLAFGEPLMTAADYAGLVSKLPRGADILAHYPATAFASAEDAYVTMRGDARVCINIDAARTLAPAGPLFMYEFEDPAPPPTLYKVAVPGNVHPQSFHTAEIASVFQTGYPNDLRPGAPPFSAQQKRLSDAMIRDWVAFVKTGRPSAESGWTDFATSGRFQLLRPDGVRSIAADMLATQHHCDFWFPLLRTAR